MMSVCGSWFLRLPLPVYSFLVRPGQNQTDIGGQWLHGYSLSNRHHTHELRNEVVEELILM